MFRILTLLLFLIAPLAAEAQHTYVQSRFILNETAPTVSTSAGTYASGDVVGNVPTTRPLVFRNACLKARNGQRPAGEIRSVRLLDKDKLSADMDFLPFSDDPTGTTFTDSSALTLGSADLAKTLPVVEIRTHYTYANYGTSEAKNIAQPVQCDKNGDLRGILISRHGSTFAYTNAANLNVVVEMISD